MGEKEQGGMLRTVIVVGLVALIAAVITMGVIGLKSNMTKNTDRAVGTIVTTKKSYYGKDINFKDYTPGQNAWYNRPRYRLPYIGDIPANNWRDIMIKLTPKTTDVVATIDINNYLTPDGGSNNDNDDLSKRTFEIRNAATNEIITQSSGTQFNADTKLKAGTTYSILIRYFNNTDHLLYDSKNEGIRTAIATTALDGHSPISVKVDSVEAATYDDKYSM